MPGGGVYVSSTQVGYDYPLQEGVRQLEEEVGIQGLRVSGMPSASMLLFQTGLALVVPLLAWNVEPTKGETRWVYPQEYNRLALDFIGPKEAREQGLPGARGLVGGWGKRMHCLGLKAFTHSSNQHLVVTASTTLGEITANW